MNPAYKKKFSFAIAILTLLVLTACNMPRTLGGPTPLPIIDVPPTLVSGPPPEPVGGIDLFIQEWHVATDGSDLNNCQPAPCATVGRALSLALSVTDPEGRNHHVVRIGPGTYTMDDSYYRSLEGNITIMGAGTDSTIINRRVDGEVSNGFPIDGAGRIIIRDLTLQNARDCIDIGETSTAEIRVVDVNLVDCVGNGVENRGSGPVELINVNISGAHGLGFGPAESTWHEHGILNFGDMTVDGGEIAANDKTGIFNWGNISLTGTTLTQNQFAGLEHRMGTAQLSFVGVHHNHLAPANLYGIDTHSTMQIDNSNIRENDRGIHVSPGGSLTLIDSTVRDHPGTALSISDTGSATVEGTTFENNGTLGPRNWTISNFGALTITHSELLRNRDGAIRNDSTGTVDMSYTNVLYSSVYPEEPYPAIYNLGGILHIDNSLIAHNSLEGAAGEGFRAGVEGDGEIRILNTTISNNNGLGAYLWGNSTISYSTIAENTQFGILTSGINVDNTIIARNAPSDCINLLSLEGSTTSGVNIDTDGSCGVEATYSPTALLLGGLADNGGLTMTHALLASSPAIDAATGSCPPIDQRDFGRPVGAGCDVGAYETGAVAAAPATAAEEEPGGATTITVLIPDTPCYTGPGPDWGFVNNFSAGTTMELVGAGFTGNGNQAWVVGTHPTAENVNCWLPGDNVTTGIPLGEMRLITVPARPTPTPLPTPDETREPAKDPTPCPLNGNGVPTC
ncbi:MAG: right-handed parallel beta-helix repeat-containing protein [Chloroflexi bacterium]|nr:MAG: right-handed parallel beta-helix repeat-containing protein [Chloroflexota bacterium]MBL1194034.1 right-handed parallel beta-helix repeat-containing protein [Chloroflexota bacterium]NOH11328.1 right-handed parallel beta-helix repeat-containing protein [Chloroflexota bacterium]